MARRLRWTLRAARQFEDICDYIAEDSPRYARHFARSLHLLARSIPEFPEAGRAVPGFGQPRLRERIHHGYRIVYRIKPEVIEIIAICHGSRDLKSSIEEPDY